MRVAHFSDLHVLSLEGVPSHRFLNKRFSGWVNLRLSRGHKHRSAHVGAVAREIARREVDHVVITGDLTNLALEQEFEAVRDLLEQELGLPADAITIVPGNHDLYTQGAMRSRRFTSFFEPYLTSDLPDLAAELPLGRFPIVKLRGPLAIIGLTSAVPRPPLVASGELGARQLDALERILAHDDVKGRTPVLAMHHPVHNPPSKMKTMVEGLWDADALKTALDAQTRGMLLHGHLHIRIQRSLVTRAGKLLSVGATSASLEHENEHKMSGFNLYEFDDAGDLQGVEAHIYDPSNGSFRLESVPKVV